MRSNRPLFLYLTFIFFLCFQVGKLFEKMWKDRCLARWILGSVQAEILKYRYQRHLLYHFKIPLVDFEFNVIEK